MLFAFTKGQRKDTNGWNFEPELNLFLNCPSKFFFCFLGTFVETKTQVSLARKLAIHSWNIFHTMLSRCRDRALNKETYPALHYPECYLLLGGYKEFFSHYPELCEPQSYVRMSDPKFSRRERLFRQKSKTWTSGISCSLSRNKFFRREKSCDESTGPCPGRRSLFRWPAFSRKTDPSVAYLKCFSNGAIGQILIVDLS